MPTDRTVIAAVERAVEADPASAPLRLHLAALLLDGGRPADALAECQVTLEREPANAEAVALAARAAARAGDADRAVGYERLLAALGASREPEQAPASPAATEADPQEAPEPPAIESESPEGRAPVVALRALEGGRDEDGEIERPAVTLADVGGMQAIKRRLEVSFLAPMRDAKMRAYYGKTLRGGLMLYGPPGCGKTFIARALAGELGARFQSIGLADVLDMWLGESERKLHEIFQTARRHAPCVLFLDEVDALGQKRSHLRHHAGRNVVNQLLAELDGAGASNEGVFVLAASNHPWDVDTALRRPGRLDRTLLVLPPDAPARLAILALHLRDRPLGDVDLSRLASHSEGFSGADLGLLCETAAESAMEDSLERGEPRPIEQRDLERAARSIQASTSGWFQVAYNYAMFANEGGVYDELLDYIRSRRLV